MTMPIRVAIMEVRNQRNEDIIFLASAGNSDTDDESFPARLPGVIGVYGTDCHGVRLPSNAAMPRNAARVLGTYGADLPGWFSDEFGDTYPNICQPGTSIATAVMAAISATLLAYATVLPSLVGPTHHVLRRLWTSDGMEAVLYRMAPDEDSRLRAVKPPVFWKNRSDDTLRHCAIHDALADVERLSPRRQATALTLAKAKPVGSQQETSISKDPAKEVKPDILGIDGHPFRINYDVPQHITDSFYALLDSDVKYEDISPELKAYEVHETAGEEQADTSEGPRPASAIFDGHVFRVGLDAPQQIFNLFR
ncbi:hypothetical protein GGR54DRAFT_35459 [Hypoxylon sp. NC1633]|nr:hypothetical protein GGR54DRAFT_35459 [Hypoxylon sp. NC1633]